MTECRQRAWPYIQKITTALRMLAYGILVDLVDATWQWMRVKPSNVPNAL
jgi:hypothetical protein